MINGNGKIPDHAHGRLVYIGHDDLEDVSGAMATIGAALHFAADHVEQFAAETNAHNEQHEGEDDYHPSTWAYHQALVFSHALASPGCAEPLPPLPEPAAEPAS